MECIGIDIEEVKPIEKAFLYQECLTDREWKAVHESTEGDILFFRYWTKKESVLKAEGQGLQVPLAKVFINGNRACIDNRSWHIKEVAIDPGYACALALSGRVPAIRVEEIPLWQQC